MPKPNTLRLENYTDDFFEVNSINGFLPKKSPLLKLPERYNKLQKLMDEMPIKKEDGSDGLLSREGAIEEGVKGLLTLRISLAKKKMFLLFKHYLEHTRFLRVLIF